MGKRPPGGAPPSITSNGVNASVSAESTGSPSRTDVLGAIKRAVSGGSTTEGTDTSAAEVAEDGGVFDGVFERLRSLETTQRDILDRIEEPSTAGKMGIEAGKGAVSGMGGAMVAGGAAVGSLVPGVGTVLGTAAATAGVSVLGGALGGAMSGLYELEWEDNMDVVEGFANRIGSLTSGNEVGSGEKNQTRDGIIKY